MPLQMKHAYRWIRPLLAMLLFFIALGVSAQQPWRPFWPGLIYSYDLRNSTNGANVAHTLRVDSVYRTPAGDSVYAFNRLMRRYVGSSVWGYVKSRNNLFGARLSWTPGQRYYTFESEAQNGVQSATSLRIYPRAAAGQSWVASTSPLLTATVQSRRLLMVLPGVQDSVATVEVRNGTATTGPVLTAFVLSRSHGLVEATPWLGGAAVGTPASAPLLATVPVPLLQSAYSPLALCTMQPGDEVGYVFEPFNYNGSIVCQRQHTLRRFRTRQQRPDSLVFTYQQQVQAQYFGWAPCGTTASIAIQPISWGRLAFSMVTGRSPQYPALQLLTGEYAADQLAFGRQAFFMGVGATAVLSNSCTSRGTQVSSTKVYLNANTGTTPIFSPGLDIWAWAQLFGAMPGMGEVSTSQSGMIYFRRSVGNPLVCGSFIDFAALLPTRAAPAAALATLYPNPVTEATTLTLAAPARSGHFLRLTDALGRLVWSAPVPAGQTAVTVPLAAQPVGLYLLHLSGPDVVSASCKVVHE